MICFFFMLVILAYQDVSIRMFMCRNLIVKFQSNGMKLIFEILFQTYSVFIGMHQKRLVLVNLLQNLMFGHLVLLYGKCSLMQQHRMVSFILVFFFHYKVNLICFKVIRVVVMFIIYLNMVNVWNDHHVVHYLYIK